MKSISTKYQVKVLEITKPLQKIHFSIRHPEDAEFITGIAVTSSLTQFRGPSDDHHDLAGTLSLAIPQSGDVFYTESLKKDTGVYTEFVELATLPESLFPSFDIAGKGIQYFNTTIPVTPAIIEGYYEDVGISPLRDVTPTYKVRVYLRYQMKQHEHRVCS